MSEVARETLDRHGEMKQIRAIEEPAWRDIALVLRPDDRDFDALGGHSIRAEFFRERLKSAVQFSDLRAAH